MLSELMTKERMLQKAEELRRGGFKPGCDGMDGKSAALWFTINADSLRETVLKGKYKPMPVSGFRVAKMSGGFRTLARLTAIDTVLQRCLLEGVSEVCEARFSENSLAYRPGRGVTQALERYCALGSAFRFASKIGPSDCFGSIDWDVLRARLEGFFNDPPLIALIMSFVTVPIFEDGKLVERSRGLPQGAPLSPVLMNLYFSGLDALLEEKKAPFARYADDLVLFSNEQSAIKELTDEVLNYIRNDLRLSPRPEKCKIAAPFSLSYLGHTFLPGKDGFLTLDAGESVPAALHAWRSSSLKNPGKDYTILSDGILRQRDFSLMLETEEGNHTIPILNTERINVFSSVVFDSGFLAAAAKNGIVVTVFNAHGHVEGRFTPNYPLRSPATTDAQLEACRDPERRLAFARLILLASIHNTLLNLRYYRKQEAESIYTEAITRLYGMDAEIKAASDHPSLLLAEARARQIYYDCFNTILAGTGFFFPKRSRRPPRDPVNALLSFGNTLLYNHLATLIEKTALDVRVGFLHATNSRAESLNLDLAELFRPLVVDRVVFTLINRKQLRTEQHFAPMENGGIYLNAKGKHLFLTAFYDKLNTRLSSCKPPMTYAELMREEVNKLVRCFRSGEPYKPFKQVR